MKYLEQKFSISNWKTIYRRVSSIFGQNCQCFSLVKSWLIQIVLNSYQYPPETKISQINYTMFFLICNRIDCYITINTFEHVVFDLSDTPYSSTFPHKFTFYRVFARKKLNWEFPVFHARRISRNFIGFQILR